MQAARAWQQSPEFDVFRKQRQVIEHRIARLIQLCMRQARYVGRRKTCFQVLMAAAVANLTLIAGQNGRRSQLGQGSAARAGTAMALGTLSRAIKGRLAGTKGQLGSVIRNLPFDAPLSQAAVTMAPFRPAL